MSDTTTEIDPRKRYTQPPFEEPEQSPPGLESEMRKKPDHGEETYEGAGRLKNRVALVTGGDSGIGRAVAIACAREGANVAISFLPEEEEDAKETARWVEDAGRRSLELPGDVRDESYCESLVERTVKDFGQLDILVNNAAFRRRARVSRMFHPKSGTGLSEPTFIPCFICRRRPLGICGQAARS